jgi:eukaryotic-like serine/threonine-protein kinase
MSSDRPSRPATVSNQTLPDLPGLEEFEERLQRAGFDEGRLHTEVHGTIVVPSSEEVLPLQEIVALPLLAGDGAQRELALKEAMGRGGMGVVRRADQLPLQREVAVKCAVAGGTNRHERASALLREGRVTGALEHPNIVPVHTLGRTADDSVLLVMKRIEGTAWAELLSARPSPSFELERHLEILMEVCRATHFAHSRGVIHRDLKPENVMVGAFGEVYVLDWGLAIAVGERAVPGALHASELTSMAGTPHYMAPEMTVLGAPLGVYTDVFLLGGILHTIVTGRPPHQGQKVQEILHAAFVAEPKTFGPDVPEELAAICQRALAREPAARFGSVEELRGALGEFLRHASARVLAREARGPLEALQALLEAERDDDLEAHRLYSACRFGFEAALRAWPTSSEARDGLAAAIGAMAEYELRRNHLDAAAVLLRDLGRPAPALEGRLADLREAAARASAEQQRLASIARELDVRPGQRRRVLMFSAAGGAWMIFGLISGAMSRAAEQPTAHRDIFLAHVLVLGVFLVIYRLAARWGEIKAGRSIIAVVAVSQLAASAHWLAMWKESVAVSAGLAVGQLFTAVGAAAGGYFLDKRILPAAAIIFAGFPLVLLLPRWAFELNSACIGGALVWIGWAWRR